MAVVDQPSKETDALLGAEGSAPSSSSTTTDPNNQQSSSWWRTPLLIIILACGLVVVVTILTTLVMDRFRTSMAVSSSPDTTTATEGSSSPSRDRKYKATQFISFTINTLGGSADDGECEGRTVDPTTDLCYLGNPHNLSQDVHHRAGIVQEVLHKLKNDVFTENPEIDRQSTVLKIVMLPEFYWRGPNGVYSVKDLYDDTADNSKDGILIQVGDRLRAIMADEAFCDYLFVAGTVLAAQPRDHNMTVAQAVQDAHNILYYNFASVVKGGPDAAAYFVQKRYISGADFLSRTTLPNPSDQDLHLYGDATLALKDTLETRGYQIVEHNVLEIDGIRIGIEICLDHRMGQLYNNIELHEHGQLVDVQLITSAGMAIERGPNPLKTGGVVSYLCDRRSVVGRVCAHRRRCV